MTTKKNKLKIENANKKQNYKIHYVSYTFSVLAKQKQKQNTNKKRHKTISQKHNKRRLLFPHKPKVKKQNKTKLK